MMADPPDNLKNRTARRDKKRLEPSRADRLAEKQLLRHEVAEEIEQRDQRKRADGGSPKQYRADFFKSLAQQNTPRKVRAYLYKFAPELETPRLIFAVEVIVGQLLLHRNLMQAHEKQQATYDQMGAALLKVVEALPPPPMEWNAETVELLEKLDRLYEAYLKASPFAYVEKIENVVAKVLALLRENGLTVKAARMMEIDLEDELLRYKGAIAAAEASPSGDSETNQEHRRRLIRPGDDPVGDGDDENEDDHEEDDE